MHEQRHPRISEQTGPEELTPRLVPLTGARSEPHLHYLESLGTLTALMAALTHDPQAETKISAREISGRLAAMLDHTKINCPRCLLAETQVAQKEFVRVSEGYGLSKHAKKSSSLYAIARPVSGTDIDGEKEVETDHPFRDLVFILAYSNSK